MAQGSRAPPECGMHAAWRHIPPAHLQPGVAEAALEHEPAQVAQRQQPPEARGGDGGAVGEVQRAEGGRGGHQAAQAVVGEGSTAGEVDVLQGRQWGEVREAHAQQGIAAPEGEAAEAGEGGQLGQVVVVEQGLQAGRQAAMRLGRKKKELSGKELSG